MIRTGSRIERGGARRESKECHASFETTGPFASGLFSREQRSDREGVAPGEPGLIIRETHTNREPAVRPPHSGSVVQMAGPGGDATM